MPSALIIGHTGQDGRILWDQLAARDFSLIGVSRHEIRTHAMQWGDSVDIANLSSVMRLMEGFKPDQVYYLAAHHHSSQEPSVDDVDMWRDSWAVNVHGLSNFLHSSRTCCPRTRFFYASSSRVFGDTSVSPQTEQTPFKPSCIYGVTKASAMLLARYYRGNFNTHVSCGVLYNHESPIRGAKFVSQRVADGLVALKYGLKSTLEVGSLDARVDWGYAPDYTRAMQLIIEAEKSEDFIIATGETHSVREMIAFGAEYLGIPWVNRVIETAAILKRNSQELCGDFSRLHQVTGWKPSIDFRQLTHILVDAAAGRLHGQTN